MTQAPELARPTDLDAAPQPSPQMRAIADQYLRGHVTGMEGREAEFGAACIDAVRTITHVKGYNHEVNDALREHPDGRLDRLPLGRAGDELAHRCATAGVLGALAWLGEAEEDAAHDLPLVRPEGGEDGVGALGKCALDAAALAVSLEREHAPAPALPQFEEGVLEEG